MEVGGTDDYDYNDDYDDVHCGSNMATMVLIISSIMMATVGKEDDADEMSNG